MKHHHQRLHVLFISSGQADPTLEYHRTNEGIDKMNSIRPAVEINMKFPVGATKLEGFVDLEYIYIYTYIYIYKIRAYRVL